jgi:hypothetical protein
MPIEALVKSAQSEHADAERRQHLRNLFPDFHPHPTPPLVSGDGDGKELTVKDSQPSEFQCGGLRDRCTQNVLVA